MQKRSDEKSKALRGEIAKKLRSNPMLWSVPKENIKRWKKERKHLIPSFRTWENILDGCDKEEILALLESDSEESTRLRSSSLFTGILSACPNMADSPNFVVGHRILTLKILNVFIRLEFGLFLELERIILFSDGHYLAILKEKRYLIYTVEGSALT